VRERKGEVGEREKGRERGVRERAIPEESLLVVLPIELRKDGSVALLSVLMVRGEGIDDIGEEGERPKSTGFPALS
jgi:hypothetical protein